MFVGNVICIGSTAHFWQLSGRCIIYESSIPSDPSFILYRLSLVTDSVANRQLVFSLHLKTGMRRYYRRISHTMIQESEWAQEGDVITKNSHQSSIHSLSIFFSPDKGGESRVWKREQRASCLSDGIIVTTVTDHLSTRSRSGANTSRLLSTRTM